MNWKSTTNVFKRPPIFPLCFAWQAPFEISQNIKTLIWTELRKATIQLEEQLRVFYGPVGKIGSILAPIPKPLQVFIIVVISDWQDQLSSVEVGEVTIQIDSYILRIFKLWITLIKPLMITTECCFNPSGYSFSSCVRFSLVLVSGTY